MSIKFFNISQLTKIKTISETLTGSEMTSLTLQTISLIANIEDF